MSRQQSGFTLIELIIVIVILGALAVVALPRFIDLEDEAQAAAIKGVAGGLNSAAAVNYAGALAGDSAAINVEQCGDVVSALQGGLNDDYQLVNTTGEPSATTPARGDVFTCTVQNANNASVSRPFEAIYITDAP